MKKKLITMILLSSMSLSLVACGTKEKDSKPIQNQTQQVEVETSIKEETTELVEETQKIEETTINSIEKDEESFILEKENLIINLPDEFEKVEMAGIIIYQVLGSSSSVNIVTTSNDGSLEDVTTDMMIEAVKPQLEALTTEDLNLKLIDGNFTEVDGHKAFKYSYSYVLEGINILQTQYMIENGDKYEVLTFADCNDEYSDDINNCMENLEYLSDEELPKEVIKEEIEEEASNKETLVIDLPEEFEIVDMNGITLYQVPGSSSNVNITTGINDGSLEDITGEMMVQVIEPQLEGLSGIDLELELIDGNFIEVDGHKAFKYAYSYEIEGTKVLQTQYMIENGDKYEVLTFSDYNDGYSDVFNNCMENLKYVSNEEETKEVKNEEEPNMEMTSEWINLDNMQFSINGKVYTLGKTTLQELIDDGVPFREDDLADAENNVKPDYESAGFRIDLGDYWTAQVYASNYTEENAKACDLAITKIYLPNKPEETQDILEFAFPLNLTEEQLLENCGEPTTFKEYKDEESDYFSNTYKYIRESTKYFGDWGYTFEFNNKGLRYLTIDLMP